MISVSKVPDSACFPVETVNQPAYCILTLIPFHTMTVLRIIRWKNTMLLSARRGCFWANWWSVTTSSALSTTKSGYKLPACTRARYKNHIHYRLCSKNPTVIDICANRLCQSESVENFLVHYLACLQDILRHSLVDVLLQSQCEQTLRILMFRILLCHSIFCSSRHDRLTSAMSQMRPLPRYSCPPAERWYLAGEHTHPPMLWMLGAS